MTASSVLPLAAIHFGKDMYIDGILVETVQALQSEGFRIGGFVQRETPDPKSCCSITHLEDIMTGSRHRISQALGAGSKGCRLDPQALAGISGDLLDLLEQGVDMLVLNRFGKGESDGHGFRAVIEKALDLGVPTLTAVRDTYQPAWEQFAGELAVALPTDAAAAVAWGRAAMLAAREGRSAA